MGACATWLLLPFVPLDGSVNIAVLMGFVVIGALVPDLDAVESKIKHVRIIGIKPLVLVARALNRAFGHRGLLHSLKGWMIWTALLLPLIAMSGWLPITALSLGYLSRLAGDTCTKTDIPVLYPQQTKWHLLPRG
jgi:inner membrane protein